MTLTIDLPPELTRQLEQEASERGLDVADYAARLLLDRTLAEHLRTVLAEMQGPPYEGLRDHLQRPELRPLAEALERLRGYPDAVPEPVFGGGRDELAAMMDEIRAGVRESGISPEALTGEIDAACEEVRQLRLAERAGRR